MLQTDVVMVPNVQERVENAKRVALGMWQLAVREAAQPDGDFVGPLYTFVALARGIGVRLADGLPPPPAGSAGKKCLVFRRLGCVWWDDPLFKDPVALSRIMDKGYAICGVERSEVQALYAKAAKLEARPCH